MKSREFRGLLNAVRYLEMRAFLNDQVNLIAGFRFLQLLIYRPQVKQMNIGEKSIKPIEDAFNKLKEELIRAGWSK